MTQAIFEILGMLLVTLGIGVYFTYRHWKSKFDELTQEKERLEKEVSNLNTEKKNLDEEIEKRDQEIVSLNSSHKSEVKKLKTQYEKESNQLRKESNEQSGKFQSEIANLKKQLDKEQKLNKKSEKLQKELENTIELKDEQLGEKEREIEELGKQFKVHGISYYKQIDGKRYKAETLKKADEAVAGVGDGRISKADAEKVFATISDGHTYTQVEKDTMHYIRENYKWTPEADELFRKKVRSWAAKGHKFE